MVELQAVSKTYATGAVQVPVLSGIDLRIEVGERVAVTGPSGCGKTTLLLLLAALERCSAGRVLFDGVDLASLAADDLADLRRDRLGIVFQAFHLLPSLSALDNIALPLEIAGRPKARERAREMLDAVGLEERASHFPSQLSGGEQQRVAIARAMVHRPALLLADEPTGNLDDVTGEVVSDLLFERITDTRSTFVLVTHDRELARRCDRILTLHEGHLTGEARVAMGAAN